MRSDAPTTSPTPTPSDPSAAAPCSAGTTRSSQPQACPGPRRHRSACCTRLVCRCGSEHRCRCPAPDASVPEAVVPAVLVVAASTIPLRAPSSAARRPWYVCPSAKEEFGDRRPGGTGGGTACRQGHAGAGHALPAGRRERHPARNVECGMLTELNMAKTQVTGRSESGADDGRPAVSIPACFSNRAAMWPTASCLRLGGWRRSTTPYSRTGSPTETARRSRPSRTSSRTSAPAT